MFHLGDKTIFKNHIELIMIASAKPHDKTTIEIWMNSGQIFTFDQYTPVEFWEAYKKGSKD